MCTLPKIPLGTQIKAGLLPLRSCAARNSVVASPTLSLLARVFNQLFEIFEKRHSLQAARNYIHYLMTIRSVLKFSSEYFCGNNKERQALWRQNSSGVSISITLYKSCDSIWSLFENSFKGKESFQSKCSGHVPNRGSKEISRYIWNLQLYTKLWHNSELLFPWNHKLGGSLVVGLIFLSYDSQVPSWHSNFTFLFLGICSEENMFIIENDRPETWQFWEKN